MLWLRFFSRFIKILRAGQSPAQIAGGFALGAVAGLSPHLTLQILLLWLLILSLNVNLNAAVLGFALAVLFSFLLDPLFHSVGYFFLVDIEALKGLWTALYNAPVAPLTRFNNTVIMGSFVISLLLFPFLFFGMRRFVFAYRTSIAARVERWKVYQVLRQNSVVRWYMKLREMGE